MAGTFELALYEQPLWYERILSAVLFIMVHLGKGLVGSFIGAIMFLFFLKALGFGSRGIWKGSIASIIQRKKGNLRRNSWIGKLQRAGNKGLNSPAAFLAMGVGAILSIAFL